MHSSTRDARSAIPPCCRSLSTYVVPRGLDRLDGRVYYVCWRMKDSGRPDCPCRRSLRHLRCVLSRCCTVHTYALPLRRTTMYYCREVVHLVGPEQSAALLSDQAGGQSGQPKVQPLPQKYQDEPRETKPDSKARIGSSRTFNLQYHLVFSAPPYLPTWKLFLLFSPECHERSQENAGTQAGLAGLASHSDSTKSPASKFASATSTSYEPR
ncbi:hypothetical protein GQ53DRAFT_548421 [Thozetella sp. PMI_491]|nr:hypothetical protein GQ53DRAFT_548421 [Thozetella sp. PMI_491]